MPKRSRPQEKPGRKADALKPIRRDGFSFAQSGLEARLYDFLYNRVPEGKRRDVMKRYMLLGFMEDQAIYRTPDQYIPPKPIELIPHSNVIPPNDPFLNGLPPVESSEKTHDVVEEPLLERSKSVEAPLISAASADPEPIHPAKVAPSELQTPKHTEQLNDLSPPKAEMKNGLSLKALAGFVG